MRIVLTTGIYPPDVGGPATHCAELAAELRARGHQATVVTLRDGRSVQRGFGLIRYPREWPWPVRMAAVAGWLIRNRGRFDVIYANGLHLPSVAAARLVGKPVVAKV